MAIFSRLSEVLAANLHGFLDKFEDPVRMAKLFVREMEDGYEKAKLSLAHQIAAERRLEAERKQARGFAEAWGVRAAEAAGEGDDALAREAIRHKIEQLDTAQRLATLVEEERKVTGDCRADLKLIEDKLSQMRRERDSLIAREGVREVTKRVEKMSAGVSGPSGRADQLGAAADRMSILTEESKALAEIEGRSIDEVEAAFADAELDRRVEEDLARLKDRITADDAKAPEEE